MGLLIATAQGSFDSNGVFAAMIVIAVVALIAEWLLTMIEDRRVNLASGDHGRRVIGAPSYPSPSWGRDERSSLLGCGTS